MFRGIFCLKESHWTTIIIFGYVASEMESQHLWFKWDILNLCCYNKEVAIREVSVYFEVHIKQIIMLMILNVELLILLNVLDSNQLLISIDTDRVCMQIVKHTSGIHVPCSSHS